MNGDQLKYSFGTGLGRLFGLPFLLAGMGTSLVPILNVTGGNAGLGPGEKLLMVLFSLPFTLVGSGLVFGCWGMTICKREQMVRTWWGLLVPFSTTGVPLDRFQQVGILKERRGSKNKSTFFVVYLTGPQEKLEVRASADFQTARQVSEEVAKFLDFPVHDHSTDQLVVREAGTLDESLRDQALRKKEQVSLPDMPENCRVSLSLSDSGDAGFLVLPEPGFGLEIIIVIVVSVAISFGLGMQFLFIALAVMKDFTPGSLGGLLFLLGGLTTALSPALGGIVYGLMEARSREQIAISPQGLVYEKTRWISRSRLTFPGQEIEELLEQKSAYQVDNPIIRAGTILVRSDKQELTLGRGLTAPELSWLHKTLRYFLVGPEGSKALS